ncbi:MAG: conserved rane protein of unknown function [Candidatus Parcubacteria bacterium]|nr:conserved rane protein of unknown function [Candidatus Parcubacteria bacterium]
MRTKITLAIIAVLIIGAIAIVVSNKQASNGGVSPFTGGTSAGSETLNPNAGNPNATTADTSGVSAGATVGTGVSQGKTYSMADVSAHTNASSCWTAINGKVYDVTSWINQHPGGQNPILSLCGKDGSSAFNGQHGGERRPASELATFYIGALVK